MPTDNRLEASRTRSRRCTDDKAGADPRPEAPRRRGRHRGRRFASRDDPYIPDVVVSERAVDERVRRGRTNAGPDDRQKVVSKLRG